VQWGLIVKQSPKGALDVCVTSIIGGSTYNLNYLFLAKSHRQNKKMRQFGENVVTYQSLVLREEPH